MLTRLFADNFRALVNFELRPDRLSLLLGENGSGKTSVFNALGKIRDLVVLGTAVGEIFSFTRTRWETRDVQRFELDSEEDDGIYRYVLEIQHPNGTHDKPFIRMESVSFDGELLYRFSDGEVHLSYDDQLQGTVFPHRPDQSYLTSLDPTRPNKVGRLSKFKKFIAGLAVFQPNPFSMHLFSKQDQDFLFRDGTNFAAFFNYLNDEHPQVRTELELRLRDALPGFRNFQFRRAGDAKWLFAAFGDAQYAGEFTLLDLSEGQRVLAVLYAAACALAREGAVLCFDEPDNFVSLSEIQPWLQVLRDALEERGGQAMIISHHPEVIDYLRLDSIWRFERPTGPVIARPLEIEGEDEFKLSEIIARGG